MNAADSSDDLLLDAVQDGDACAWRELIERYEGRLLSFATRRLSDRTEAEDTVQETFLGLIRSLPNFDRRRSLETYLFAILRNKLTDHFRKRRAGTRQSLDTLELDENPSVWISAATPSDHLAEAESKAAQRAALVEALRNWTEHCRQQQRFQDLIVVEMLVVAGLRNKEVAADLGLAETAVAGVKFRVVEQWKKAAQGSATRHHWGEADLAADSTIGRIWREEGISCLKRSTLGRFLLGVLEADWTRYVDFHTDTLRCERCLANLADLEQEEASELEATLESRRERLFASSVGFLSKRPD